MFLSIIINLSKRLAFLYCLLMLFSTFLHASGELGSTLKTANWSQKTLTSVEKIWFERQKHLSLLPGNKPGELLKEWSYQSFEYLKTIEIQKYREGRNNIFSISANLFMEAHYALNNDKNVEAIKLLEYAIQISPLVPESYFKLSSIYFFRIVDIGKGFLYLARGIKSYFSNLHGLIIDFGNIFLFLFFALIICIFIYIPLVIITYIRPVFYDLCRVFSFTTARNGKIIAGFLIITVFIFPLFIDGYKWEYLFIFLLIFSPYFRRKDLILSVAFTLFLIISPILLNVAFSFLTYSSSITRDIINVELGVYEVEHLAKLDQQHSKEVLKNRSLLFTMGNYYLKSANYSKAITYFEHLINLDPEYSKAYNNLGNAYFYAGKYENAKLAYMRSLELNNRSASNYFNLSRLYFTTKQQIDDQRYFLNRSKELDPELVAEHIEREKIEGAHYLIIDSLSTKEIFSTLFTNTKDKRELISRSIHKAFRVYPFFFNYQIGAICLIGILIFYFLGNYYGLSRVCYNCGLIEANKRNRKNEEKSEGKTESEEGCLACKAINEEKISDPFSHIYQSICISNKHKRTSYLSITTSFLIPGTGHYLLGRSFIGLFITMVFWVFLLKTFFFNGIIIDAFDLSLISITRRYVVFYSLLLFFYILIVQNIFYEVKIHNER